ncbi:MAG TPA: serine hydrolase [Pyrinomonadaceae bacterium]
MYLPRSISGTSTALLLLLSFITATLPVRAQSASAAAQIATDYSTNLETIEAKSEARRKELGIPGMALVIVKDDKIIFIKGFGYKDFENKVAVTPDTEFAIGSATKAFTALTVLMAQDEGKLSITDSPKKYLSYFHMSDPDTDKNIQIRDLLCHASGLNRTDLAMITGRLNREQLIEVAGDAKPTAKLREKFQYQNIMYSAAGEIASRVEKTPYEKLVSERIFKPLGMTNTTITLADLKKAKDYSYGYNYNFDTKETAKVPYRDISDTAAAGSINSSARDMAEWLRFVMNGGVVNGKHLVSEAGYTEWLKPQMNIQKGIDYGFGWFLQDWNGLKVVQHGGNIDGFNSMVAMIPEKKLGFVMLTNVGVSPLGNDLMPIIWSNILGDPAAHAPKLDATTRDRLTGKYRLAAAGLDVDITPEGNELFVSLPGQKYRLINSGADTFKMDGLPNGFAVKFVNGASSTDQIVLLQPDRPDMTLNRVRADGTVAGPAATAEKKEEPKAPITVDELRSKIIEAAGGEANIRKVTSRVTEADIDMQNQGVKGTSTSWTKAGSKTASETHLTALGKEIAERWEYFDGTAGAAVWSFAPKAEYTGKRLADVRRGADLYDILDRDQFKNVTVTGVKKVGDEDAYVVRFEVKDGTDYVEYYSTKTFLLLQHDGVEVSSTSSLQVPFTTTYSDYRNVDGLMLPFKTVTNSISQGDIVTSVRSVKQNVPVDDNIFAARSVK